MGKTARVSPRKRGKTARSGPRGRASASGRAQGHRQVRVAHSSEIAEDYVEAIAEIIARSGRARVTDLADHFGVSHVTVNRTIARLKRAGLVASDPYGPVALTPAGSELAAAARRRHSIVIAFLIALGVDSAVARVDAEGIEHHVSPATLDVMEKRTATLNRSSGH